MSFLIPESVFEQHIIVLGKTGSGKSSAIRLLVEHLLEKEKPITIVDPKGDWWGLKSSASGKQAGYPVVIFGGEHGDVPLNSRSGGSVAELTATGNRPCIIDLGGWMPGDRTQFWIDFASTYFRTSRGLRWLVIDEVHNFCFKGKVLSPDAGKMLHWSNRLASEGRGKGISLIAASQRPQKVHNDFLTSCETLIAMRVIHAADRQALKDWIDGCGDIEKGKELLNSIALMKRGEGWVWSPETEFGPKQIHFPMFSTYDSFKPQAAHTEKLKGWAEVNLDEVKKKLETVVKEAEANDPTRLRSRIRELEMQLRKPTLATAEKPVADPKAIERAIREVKAQAEKQIIERDRLIDRLNERIRQAAIFLADKTTVQLPKHKELEAPTAKVIMQSIPKKTFEYKPKLPEPNTNDSKLRSGAERMLAALAQWHPGGMSEGQMRSHAGLKKSGTFSAYMSDLRRGNYIEERGGEVFATKTGLEYCEHVPAAPSTTEEVLAIWKPKLRDGARRMLDVLVDLRGEPILKDVLGERSQLVKSGTFSAYLSDLRTARLVIVNHDGTVAANKETLFLD